MFSVRYWSKAMKSKEQVEKHICMINWHIERHKEQVEFYMKESVDLRKVSEYSIKIELLEAERDDLEWVLDVSDDTVTTKRFKDLSLDEKSSLFENHLCSYGLSVNTKFNKDVGRYENHDIQYAFSLYCLTRESLETEKPH